MQKRASRIIIDTNLWISFLITRDFTSLDEVIFSKKGILIFSQELLDEFLDVANRPKFRRFFPTSDIEEQKQLMNMPTLSKSHHMLIFAEIKKTISYWHWH